jgi:hypothetical protein
MPSTDSAINACGAIIRVADEFGDLIDISGSSNEVSLDFDAELGDYKVFGDAAKYRLECGIDASLDLTVVYTTGTREGMSILKRWRKNRGLRVVHVLVGADLYKGSFLLEKMSLPLKSDDAKPIMVKASLKPNGNVDIVEG